MEFSARSQGLRVQFGLPERLLKFRLSKPRFRLSLGSRTDKKPAYNYLPVWLFICYARFQRKQETRSGRNYARKRGFGMAAGSDFSAAGRTLHRIDGVGVASNFLWLKDHYGRRRKQLAQH